MTDIIETAIDEIKDTDIVEIDEKLPDVIIGKVNSVNQINIPKNIRDSLKLQHGDVLKLQVVEVLRK